MTNDRRASVARRASEPRKAESTESKARRAIGAARGDNERAVLGLARLAETDATLRKDLVLRGAQATIGLVYHHGRESAAAGRVVFPAANPSYLERATPAARESMLDLYRGLLGWPLPGSGKPLGDATREEIRDSLAESIRLRDGNAVDVRFQELVLRALKRPRSATRKHLTGAQLDQLWKQAEQEIRG